MTHVRPGRQLIGIAALRVALLLSVLLFPLRYAEAQDAPPPAPPSARPDAPPPGGAPVDPADAETEESSAAPKPAAAPAAPKGDVVTLKNGKVLSGVQVVRESPTKVEVQVVPGVEPISILRRQVASIEYDALAPSDVKVGESGGMPAPAPGEGKGETSIELAQKLGTSVTDEPLELKDRDVLEVVKELAAKVDLPLEILPEVQRMPEQDRTWTATIPAKSSLMSVLREWLPKSFPTLDVEITNDRVRLRVKPEGGASDGN